MGLHYRSEVRLEYLSPNDTCMIMSVSKDDPRGSLQNPSGGWKDMARTGPLGKVPKKKHHSSKRATMRPRQTSCLIPLPPPHFSLAPHCFCPKGSLGTGTTLSPSELK